MDGNVLQHGTKEKQALWWCHMMLHIYIYIYSILLYKSLCWWAQETTHKLLEVLLLHLTAVHPVNQIYLCWWATRLLCPPYPKLMLCDSSPTHQLAAPSKILSSSATLWQFNCTTIAHKASYGVSPLMAKRMMSHTNLISVDHSVSLRVCLERSPGLVPNPVWRFHKYGIHLQKFHPPIPCVTLSYVCAPGAIHLDGQIKHKGRSGEWERDYNELPPDQLEVTQIKMNWNWLKPSKTSKI